MEALRTPQIKAVDRYRGHRFCPPQTDLRRVPPLHGTEDDQNPKVWLHYFSQSADWWVTELDPTTGEAYGLVRMFGSIEGGYFSLPELGEMEPNRGAVCGIERDCHWGPVPVSMVG